MHLEWGRIIGTIMIMWVALAISHIKVRENEERFFEDEAWVRIFGVFLTAYLYLTDMQILFHPEPFLSAVLITGGYYFLIEL